MSLLKCCPRCRKLIPISKRYCDDCQPVIDQKSQQSDKYRHKRYNSQRTDDREIRFYKSMAWRQVRQSVIVRYHGLCVVSYVRDHMIVPMQTIHHIVPVKDDWSRRLDINNLIPISESIHQQVEKAYRNGRKREKQHELFQILKQFKA